MYEGEDYEDIRLDDTPERVYVCGGCNTEMNEVASKAALCQKCGKRGWDITFRCPKCGEEVIRFRQDHTASPPCYSCD